MVEHGVFEGSTDYITLRPESNQRPERSVIGEEYKARFGAEETKIPVEKTSAMTAHVNNFLECIRTRNKPRLDVTTAACAQVLITMSVESYRKGKILYFDEREFKVKDKPPRV
jgi:hypothetical protein